MKVIKLISIIILIFQLFVIFSPFLGAFTAIFEISPVRYLSTVITFGYMISIPNAIIGSVLSLLFLLKNKRDSNSYNGLGLLILNILIGLVFVFGFIIVAKQI